jgi:hypothetical protein
MGAGYTVPQLSSACPGGYRPAIAQHFGNLVYQDNWFDDSSGRGTSVDVGRDGMSAARM